MPLFKISIQEVYADESGPRDVSDVTKQSQGSQTLGETIADAIAACSVREKYLLVAEVVRELDGHGLMMPLGMGDEYCEEVETFCALAHGVVDGFFEGDERDEIPDGTIIPFPVAAEGA